MYRLWILTDTFIVAPEMNSEQRPQVTSANQSPTSRHGVISVLLVGDCRTYRTRGGVHLSGGLFPWLARLCGTTWETGSQQRHFLQASKDVFVCSILIYVQRIRAFTTMRDINLRFTYLLTCLLPLLRNCDKFLPFYPSKFSIQIRYTSSVRFALNSFSARHQNCYLKRD